MAKVEEDYARIEYDPLCGHHSLILPRHPGKPQGFITTKSTAPFISAEDCHFCPGKEDVLGAILDADETPWNVLLTENRWPVLPGHSMVILTSRHVGLYDMTVPEWERALRLIGKTAGDKNMMVFANSGLAAGASQPHAHAQLLDYPKNLPQLPETSRCIGPGCVLCRPRKTGTEVFKADGWVCISPDAPMISHELRLVADSHRDKWEESLAGPLVSAIAASQSLLGPVPFNIVFHVTRGAHAHAHIVPRVGPVSVYDMGWGLPTVTDPVEYAYALKSVLAE